MALAREISCPEALAPELFGELLERLLGDGLGVQLRVTGHSMSPFIRSGDVVTLLPRSPASIRSGDVVAFLRGERRLVLHRVVGRRHGALLTRGDAAPRLDGPVEASEILAVVAWLERRGARVRLGLGPERLLIASLSRWGLLIAILRPLRWLASRIRR